MGRSGWGIPSDVDNDMVDVYDNDVDDEDQKVVEEEEKRPVEQKVETVEGKRPGEQKELLRQHRSRNPSWKPISNAQNNMAVREREKWFELELKDTKWTAPILKEIENMEKNDVFDIVDYVDQVTIGSIFVLTEKERKDEKFLKARWVGNGSTQCYEHPTFAPTLKSTTLRVLMSYAVKNGLNIHHLDVNAAYLNAELKEAVYMRPPREMKLAKGKILKLKKAIYGLKQSGRAWREHLVSKFEEIGFKPLVSDDCVFKNDQGVIISVYVDDMFVFSKDSEEFNGIKKQVEGLFSIKDNGMLKEALGIEFHMEDDTIKMTQCKYIDKLLDDFGLSNETKVVWNPMVPGCNVDDSPNFTGVQLYQRLIGSLNYIANMTRPDIIYAVNYLARRNVSPTEAAFAAAKRVLRYLKTTRNEGLYFDYLEYNSVIYCDASFANERKSGSVGGRLIVVNGTVVNCKSNVLRRVVDSVCDAELLALKEGVKDVKWINVLLKELGLEEVKEAKVDNTAALQLATDAIGSHRSRHMVKDINFLKSEVKLMGLQIKHVNSEDNWADYLTKSLSNMDVFKRNVNVV
jgi:hypothetical protein